MRAIVPTLVIAAQAATLMAQAPPSARARYAELEARAQIRAAAAARSQPTRAGFATMPPAAWQSQDPGDSLYRSARSALNRGDYRGSADRFQELRRRYPRSAYVADSYYWEAYSRMLIGREADLRAALGLLENQASRHADASTRASGDARSLEARIKGELARRGDETLAREVLAEAARAAAAPPAPPAPSAPRAPRAGGRGSGCDNEDDFQSMALNSVLQMDAVRAVPILEKVLERRDPESLCLRRRAVFIVSQHRGQNVDRILLQAARTDPDAEVRTQAVFWLSQVNTPGAVVALDSILSASTDREVQDKAIFALSQHRSAEAQRALRRYAERQDIDSELMAKAIFWLGQNNNAENVTFLRTLYGRVTSEAVKDRIIFAVSQSRFTENGPWLVEVARNTREPLELRKKALFWLGQHRNTSGADLASLYGTFTDRDMKEQIIFALSQKNDSGAVDKLLDIARRDPDPELRKKAIFWLTQTNDPRVSEILLEILSKP